jgi:hypothetical protein
MFLSLLLSITKSLVESWMNGMYVCLGIRRKEMLLCSEGNVGCRGVEVKLNGEYAVASKSTSEVLDPSMSSFPCQSNKNKFFATDGEP